MSTHSRIGIQNEDGTFTTIYCRFDGNYSYKNSVGSILFKHYITITKIKKLIHLGDLSSLGPTIGEKHYFHKEEIGDYKYCTAFHRDEGNSIEETKPIIIKDLEKWARDYYYSYNYFFRENEWWMFSWDNLKTLNPVGLELAFLKLKEKK